MQNRAISKANFSLSFGTKQPKEEYLKTVFETYFRKFFCGGFFGTMQLTEEYLKTVFEKYFRKVFPHSHFIRLSVEKTAGESLG